MELFNDNLIRTYKWWEDNEQISHFTECGIPEDTMKKILATADLLEEIYPEMWDIQMTIEARRLKPRAVIKFPEIEITNSNDLKHTIYDLYFRFDLTAVTDDYFDDGRLKFNIDNLYGTRGKVSYGELTSGYKHSHLESSNFSDMKYTHFCLGSSEIEQAMVLINNSPELDVNLIRYFLLHIQTYINWESLEGGPYIKMKSIARRGEEGNLLEVKPEIYRRLSNSSYVPLYNTLSHDVDIDLDSKNAAIVIDNERFDDKVNHFFKEHFGSGTTDKYMYYRDENGVYFGSFGGVEKFKKEREPIIFQGQEVHLELVDEMPDESNIQLYLHPDIKQFIKNRIEYELRKKQAIIAFRQTRYSSADNRQNA